MIALTREAPQGVQQMVQRTVDKSFASGEMLLEQVITKAPQWAASFLGGVPDGLLTVGTALLSAYLISARLPRMKQPFTAGFLRHGRSGISPPGTGGRRQQGPGSRLRGS